MPLHDMRAQAHDGASNMLGKNSGVAKRLKDEHPKALETHCLGHCLNLSVSSVNKVSRGMKDCMDVCLEIIKLIKFSPKREAKLEELKLKDLVETESHEELESNDYGQTNGDRERPLKLKKFCTTRWTLRHVGFRRVRENYKALLQLWEHVLNVEKGLTSDVKGRIIGVLSKMRTHDFLFYLELAIIVCSQTDNLSKTLQSTRFFRREAIRRFNHCFIAPNENQ